MKISTDSFIVRIWFPEEHDDDPEKAWRGVIEHVGTHRRLYFHDLGAIGRFVQEQSRVGGRKSMDRLAPFWDRLAGFADWIKHGKR